MIKNLRTKLATTSFVATNIVLIVAIIFIFLTGFSRIATIREDNMLRALDYPIYQGNQENFAHDFNDVVLVVYDKTANKVANLFVGENIDKDFVEKVFDNVAKIAQSGSIEEDVSLKLQYKKQVIDDNFVKIVFYDPANYRSGYAPFIFYCVGAMAVGVLLHSMISLMLAQSAIAPIEDTWNKQRRFVADASHELKTPLSVIMANMEIISSHPTDTVESQQKWINNTVEEAKRMASLVADLLFLAKSDEGLKVAMQPTSFTECVQSCVLTQEAVFYENKKNFSSQIADDVTVFGNEGQLKQLVTILLDNANKYSLDDGNIDLCLSTTNKNAILTVSNDSHEVSPEQVTHLFDRFYTLDASRNKNKGGNGLGLSIAHTIVQSHKGKISAEYKNGKMTFKATIPLSRNKKPPKAQ